MAGEWIAVDCSLPQKMEILKLTRSTGEPVDAIVGRLVLLWTYAQLHSADGTIEADEEMLSAVAGGTPEFWREVAAVGWLRIEDQTVAVTGWEERFSKAAKRRLTEALRKKVGRELKKAEDECPQDVRMVSAKRPHDVRIDADARPQCVRNVSASRPQVSAKRPHDCGLDRRDREEEIEEKETVATSVPRSRPPSVKISWNPSEGWSGITAKDRAGWAEAYPAVNLDRALAAMSEWLKANPSKARRSNWRAFVTRWLTREQDRGGDAQSNRPGATVTPKENRRYFRSDAHKSLTDAEYEAWKGEQGSQRQVAGQDWGW